LKKIVKQERNTEEWLLGLGQIHTSGGKDDQEGAHTWLQGLISNTDATCHFVGGYVPPVG
jgi:hypothetical protein